MAFDFKKEYKEFYMPKNKPEIVSVPKAHYVAVRGSGDPNKAGGLYQQAIGVLYAVSYTLKMSYKTDYKIKGFFEYVVPPLEGFWWQDGVDGVDDADKSAFHWISVIRLPEFVTRDDFEWAVRTAEKKKKMDCSQAELLTVEEGLCVQMMHIGAFDSEPESVARMDEYLRENGYENDRNETRLHHEIYLSDPRRVAPEKWKTVIRHPVKKAAGNRAERAEALHQEGYNCAQAVACAFSDLTEMPQDMLFRVTEGYGAGMGGMRGTCGAISGAVAVAGLLKSEGSSQVKSKVDTYRMTKQIVDRFEEKNGVSRCCELKGSGTGKAVRACAGCIRDAAEILEEMTADITGNVLK